MGSLVSQVWSPVTPRGRWGTVVASVQQRQMTQVLAVAGGLVMSLIGLYAEWAAYGLIGVLVVAVGIGIRNYGALRRVSRELSRDDVPETLAPEALARITTLVTPFDEIRPGARPAPVMAMVDHLPHLRNIRLVVVPDAGGSTRGTDRRASLEAWLAAYRPHLAIDVQLLDARVSPFTFGDGEDTRLAHALAAAKSLGGLAVDVTGGTKVMSITAIRAAEAASAPVTYLVQPPADQPKDGFYGITLLSDPEGSLLTEEGES